MLHQNVRGGDEKMSTHALQERQAYDEIKDLRFLAFRATKPCFAICLCGSLRRRRSKPSVYSVCELVHNIVFESRRVAKKYVGVIDWLFSFAVCD